MKNTIMITVTILAASILVGCSSPKGGGMSSDEGFTLSSPFFTTDIQQGDRKTVVITIDRDKYFKQDVRLQVTTTPGITVDPMDILVRADDSPDVKFQISAPQDAALGQYLVRVKGIPQTGQPTSTEITVKVVSP